MDKFEQILVKYWGYTSFRSIQKEVIASVVEGRDTLALMPTGGGKSITFQVAALAAEGLCVVVTPLVALMKDQVDTLRKKGIKAAYVHAGMRADEIGICLDNCVYGGYKFLYVSPERLGTELFLKKLGALKVNLVAVDEAHCISQWGYDFRPSYLRIAEVRSHLPNVPVLAVTATAIPEVAKDIQKQLKFGEENCFSTSFARENLTYVVRNKEDKMGYLLSVLKKNKGAGVVYVRSRRKAKEIAIELYKHGVPADFYHAGLNPKDREEKQNRWKHGQSVMVCTNAFGMGIDKTDVRYVIHLDLPESPEAYFQEAGRAGRDGKNAYAVLLYCAADVKRLQERFESQFPPIPIVKRTYQALGNYYQIPVGYGKGSVKEFNIADFCEKYKLQAVETFSCIKLLQQEGYIELSETMDVRSKVRFVVGREDLYAFQVKNKQFDGFIKLLLRTYSGIFTDYAKIDEETMAAKAGVAPEMVSKFLKSLHKVNVINYFPASRYPMLVFTTERLADASLIISHSRYNEGKNRHKKRTDAMIAYATEITKCRSQFLLSYFGQNDSVRCGTCDICQSRNDLELSKLEFDNALSSIKERSAKPVLLELLADNGPLVPEKMLKVVEWLLDHRKILQLPGGMLQWHE